LQNSVSGPLSGNPEAYGSRDLGTYISIHREIIVSCLKIWGIFLYGSFVRGTWKGVPLLGALMVMNGRLWRQASFYRAQLGISD
jgi:hypothetical protein